MQHTRVAAAFIAVIPARYQSARLPGKPLADIAGKPMLLHVVERARQSHASAVIVATDDARIAAVCTAAGVSVCMTDPAHNSGTDRIAEAVTQLGYAPDTIVVNVQGDEPLIPPTVIDQVAANLAARPAFGICTLYAALKDEAEFRNPNAVKLVSDATGKVLYFSRAPIPWPRDGSTPATLALAKRHIGLYAYRVRVLQQFVAWPPAALETVEKLEQLRAMAQGVSIHAEAACAPVPAGVDTLDDLEQVRQLLRAGLPHE
ncbi:MAG: 3-deoxy-manno-octulosonate cytidylyltransferase [Pseudomonadales bacterium]|jgi:3-deoxy-manno-octulosonate cytidylyltransferase (CMP-KDO synthetase)|nr:3-deoxy-manno-octulosonate cytidylyltransferase [Pseudomonadales bacterium]